MTTQTPNLRRLRNILLQEGQDDLKCYECKEPLYHIKEIMDCVLRYELVHQKCFPIDHSFNHNTKCFIEASP